MEARNSRLSGGSNPEEKKEDQRIFTLNLP
jgi:hypothetical protein